MNQITIYATITDTTPATITAILTNTDLPGTVVQDLRQPPIAAPDRHKLAVAAPCQ
jgi:hypothetical protein